jgi:hypothetical protein
VLLSPNESFAEGPAPGLRSVRTTRDPSSLASVSRVIDELRRLVAAGDRDGLSRACLSAAESLQ